MAVLLSHSFWVVMGILSLAVWMAVVAVAAYNQRRILWLDPVPDGEMSDKLISVVVPARNEAGDIGAALRSVLAQQDVRLEVIAVNDHSSDGTGRIMDETARCDSRLGVIHDPPLEPGWLGKANAMRVGLERAAGEYVLFSDGDVIHQPRCFVSALTELARRHYDMISCLPLFRVRLFWEHVMLPMFVAALAKLVPERRQQDQRHADAAASGAFILIKRDILRKIGDLQAIKGSLADDMALARAVKRCGFSAGYRFAPSLMSLRLYKGNREAFISSSKNILLVIEESLWLSPFIPLFTFMLAWSPWIMIGLGTCHRDPLLAAAGLIFYGAAYAGLFVCRPLFSFRWLPALAFPLVLFVVSYCISRAYFLHLRGMIEWRGRVIRVR